MLFSAAIPCQGGFDHINEQPQDYWIEKFKKRGFTAYDPIRPSVWSNPEVPYYYAQNIILFSRRPLPFPTHFISTAIHPELFRRRTDPRTYALPVMARHFPGCFMVRFCAGCGTTRLVLSLTTSSALNEEVFIKNQLQTLYPFCSGISVITQYDRELGTGKPVEPDLTAAHVLGFPDPLGKIHFVVRRSRDEAAARNQEMLALSCQPHRQVMSHGVDSGEIKMFHDTPDYFLIVDADEMYNTNSLPNIIDFLARKRPRGLRMHAYNYVKTWNRRVPSDVVQILSFWVR